MSQTYAWLVQKGTVNIWKDEQGIHVNTGNQQEGSILTNEDALEIGTILYHLAKDTPGY